MGRSSGSDGTIGYCLGYNGGQDAHVRSAQTLIGLCVAGKEVTLRRSIGGYLANNPHSMREVLEMSATGDLFKTQELFDAFVQTCGRPPPLEKEIAYLEWLLHAPRGQAVRRWGGLYWSLVDRWSKEPRSKKPANARCSGGLPTERSRDGGAPVFS